MNGYTVLLLILALTYCSAEGCPLMDFVKALSDKVNNAGKTRNGKGGSPLKELSQKFMKMLNGRKKREATWSAEYTNNAPIYAGKPSELFPN